MRRVFIVISTLSLSLLIILGLTIALASVPKSSFGTVDGSFRMIGGPPPGMNRLVSGYVTLNPAKNNHQQFVKIVVNASGKFTALIRVGIWNVSGRTPNFDSSQSPCNGGRITVKSGQIVPVSVQCEVP
jgi:hypothetical protein